MVLLSEILFELYLSSFQIGWKLGNSISLLVLYAVGDGWSTLSCILIDQSIAHRIGPQRLSVQLGRWSHFEEKQN